MAIDDNTIYGLAGSQIKDYATKIKQKRIYYGTSSTAAGTNEKVVTTVDGNFKLETGAVLFVGFTNKCAGSPAYLKVDNATAARVATIMQDTGTYNIWDAKEVVGFVYDGTHFVCFGRKSASTSSYGLTYLTTSATADYEYTSATPQSINLLAQNMLAGANVYSTTATYAVGDLCRHDYKIYVCNTAITTAESWTAAHWTALPSFQSQIDTLSSSKQDTLVSGTNIKTVNSTSLLGSGNVAVQPTLVSGTNIKTINSTSLLGSGNISIPVITVDSSMSSSSTNPVQNKVVNTALAGKVDGFTMSFYGQWSGGPHAVKFCEVDYSTANSENGIFIKFSMVNSHGNGEAGRFLQDVILNVKYTGDVVATLYRYFSTQIVSSSSPYHLVHDYGDVFWTIDTTNKIVKFFVLMHQFSYTRQTPYFRLNTSTGGIITQSNGGNREEYSSGTQNWSTNYSYDDIRPVDSSLSSTSTNPVQNKTIYNAIGNVEAILQTLNSGSGV